MRRGALVQRSTVAITAHKSSPHLQCEAIVKRGWTFGGGRDEPQTCNAADRKNGNVRDAEGSWAPLPTWASHLWWARANGFKHYSLRLKNSTSCEGDRKRSRHPHPARVHRVNNLTIDGI